VAVTGSFQKALCLLLGGRNLLQRVYGWLAVPFGYPRGDWRWP